MIGVGVAGKIFNVARGKWFLLKYGPRATAVSQLLVDREEGRELCSREGEGKPGRRRSRRVGIGCCTKFMTFIYAQLSNWSPTK